MAKLSATNITTKKEYQKMIFFLQLLTYLLTIFATVRLILRS